MNRRHINPPASMRATAAGVLERAAAAGTPATDEVQMLIDTLVDASEAQALQIALPREFCVRVDNVCSLIGHRYWTNVPLDVREELLAVAEQARTLYQSKPEPETH